MFKKLYKKLRRVYRKIEWHFVMKEVERQMNDPNLKTYTSEEFRKHFEY